MGRYLKQGFVRELEWKLNKEEISYSKMVELMEEECIKNYKKEEFNTEVTYNFKNPPLPPKDREISLGGGGRKKPLTPKSNENNS